MLISELGSAIRFAIRQICKSPGFSLTVAFTLALGITATTVIFSVVDAVVLQPLPLPESGRLVSLDTLESINRGDRSQSKGLVRNETSYPNFFDWRSLNKSFSSIASYSSGGLVLGSDSAGPARRIGVVQVSSDFFLTLGVSPALGRGFTGGEESPGSRVAVLGNDLWKTQFDGDPKILGKTVILNEQPYTIVGVMPHGFDFPVSNTANSVWITMAADAEGNHPSTEQRGYNQLSVIGRLRPGVTIDQARAEMSSIQQSLANRYPDDDQNETAVSVIPELQDIVSDVRTPLRILFAAVSFLLLIVCANVAGLMLARNSRRRSELAIRSALGASQIQILGQLLSESLLLSFSGGVIGILATRTVLKTLPALLPANLPRIHQISLSGGVLAFAVLLSILTGLFFGALPAWRASKQDPALVLAENGRGATGGRKLYRTQSILVISQTAIGLVLLVGAGLLIRSFDQTIHVDPGFYPQQVLTFRISIPNKRYDESKQNRFFRQLLLDLQHLPGVQMTTAAFPLPLTQGDINISFSIAGHPTRPGDEPSARVSLVEPQYFQTLRIPLKHGRFFLSLENDEKGPPVVIVNEAFARQFFPGQNALGQHIRSGLGTGDPPPMREIVGVVGNAKRASLTETDKPEYYIPYEQAPVATPAVAMRVIGDPGGYAGLVRSEVAKLDKSLPVYRLQSYEDDLVRVTAQQRFQARMLSVFAAIAVLLAGLGLYATLTYMVENRASELGLRIALGAPRNNVLRLILLRGLKLAILGLCLGLPAAALLTRLVSGLLYGVKPLDFVTFASMTVVLLLVSILASLIPAWRACMVDPNEILRNQ